MSRWVYHFAQFVAGEVIRKTSSGEKDPTASKLRVVEESEATAMDEKLQRSHLNNHKRASWKPSKWFSKKHHSAALPPTDPSKLDHSNVTSRANIYHMSGALSSPVLSEYNRPHQVVVHKERPDSMANIANPLDAGQIIKMPIKMGGIPALNKECYQMEPLRFSNSIPKGDIDFHKQDGYGSTFLSPPKAPSVQSWTDTPVSKYFPQNQERVSTSNACSRKEACAHQAPEVIPSSAISSSESIISPIDNIYYGQAANTSLYDGSSWGPISPRTVETQILPYELRSSLQDRLANNARNRMSLPESLRYGASVTPSPQSKRASTNPLEVEFDLSMSPAERDCYFENGYIAPSPAAQYPSKELFRRSASSSVFNRYMTDNNSESTNRAEMAKRTDVGIMTKSDLTGSPFALPYRSHSTMFSGKEEPSLSVRQRRGFSGRLLVDVSEESPVAVAASGSGSRLRYRPQ